MMPIRAIAFDIDGVLTDDGLYVSPDARAVKRFSVRDRSGLWRALREGLRIALISGDSTPDGVDIGRRYAETLGLTDVWLGCHDKAKALCEFASRHGLALSEVCFMGDDTLDVPAMRMAGTAAAPCDAHPSVLAVAHRITRAAGGRGAVRELVDAVLDEGGVPVVLAEEEVRS